MGDGSYVVGDQLTFSDPNGSGTAVVVQLDQLPVSINTVDQVNTLAGDVLITATSLDVGASVQLITEADANDPSVNGKIALAGAFEDDMTLDSFQDLISVLGVDVESGPDVTVTLSDGVLLRGGEIEITAEKTANAALHSFFQTFLAFDFVGIQDNRAAIDIGAAQIFGSDITISASTADVDTSEDEAFCADEQHGNQQPA